MQKILVSSLAPGFYLYGNKGNVWKNTAHIYRSGVGNLCGTPALATNYARLDGLKEIGCPKCIEAYNKLKADGKI